MSTPIEDRVATLEALTQQQTTALTNQAKRIATLENALTTAGPRITALESQYADAVVRYQKADRLMLRLILIIRTMVEALAPQIAKYFDRFPEDERVERATEWEKVTSGGRFDPDNGS